MLAFNYVYSWLERWIMILIAYGDNINSLFQLLDKHKNDITKAIAYSLSKMW